LTVVSETGGRLVREGGESVALQVSDMQGDACFEYDVAVAAMASEGAARRTGRTLALRPGSFLLRAGVVPDDLDATISIEVPKGISVAVPFDPIPSGPGGGPGRWRLPPSTWPFQGWMLVGPFQSERFTVAGCEVELVRSDGPFAATPAGIRRWLSTAISADAVLFGGTFPRRRLLLGVEAGNSSDGDAVTFGSAWAGGGAHALLWLSKTAKDDALPGEWVAVHELLHSALPHVAIDDAWLSEGFVTYYQEVVRARAGLQTPEQAWQEIHAGFGRGRVSKSRRPIAEESRAMHENHEYHRVYWAGAAIALRLDVALRRESQGRLSLDDALRALCDHPGADVRTIEGREVVEALDRKAGSPLASSIVNPILASGDFPDLSETYRFLGLGDATGALRFDDAAPGAAIRRAIMARPAAAGTPPNTR
jgi:hypothetical protein